MSEDMPDPRVEPHDFHARKWSYRLELLIHGILVVTSVLAVVFGLPGNDLPGILGSILPRLGGALGTWVFGYAALNVTRLLRDPRPALRISEEGILNRTYWSTTTMVPWDEILEIKKSRITAALEVVLRDPDAFRDKQDLAPRFFWRVGSLLGRPKFLVFLPQLKATRAEVFDRMFEAHSAVELAAIRDQALLSPPEEPDPSEDR